MKKIIKIILFLTLTLLMSLTSIKANEKIKIGLLIPLTGKNSEIGEKKTPPKLIGTQSIDLILLKSFS